MPFELFIKFVEEAKELNIFEEERSGKIAIEFKIMIGLRILGRDNCADDISEYLNIVESTITPIFKQFVSGCVKYLYPKYVYIPEGEELDQVSLVYEKLGLPGCIGSMDCTHILWHRCPKVIRNNCTGKCIVFNIIFSFLTIILFNIGKESKPTLAFQVVVSHSKKFMHVSEHFYGTMNDKQITVNDTFPVDVWHGDKFKLRRFILINKHGVAIEYQGVWLAVDGGYQKIACFIDPMHNRYSFDEVAFKMSNVLSVF